MKKFKKGFTGGVFDLFHVGHLNLIRRAKSHCEYLIVGVHSDKVVREYKNKPTIKQNDRRRIIAALRHVDEAVINSTRDYLQLYEKYRFDVLFIGDDWKGSKRWEEIESVLNPLGVEIIYLPYTHKISTSIIKKMRKQ